MRHWLLILGVIFCSVEARAAIALVTSCTPAAATSCTLQSALTAANYGNIMVSYAYRSNSTAAPTPVSGWTAIENGTGANTNGRNMAWKFSVGNETTCGAWTNATQTMCQVYSGAMISSAGPVGGKATGGSTGTTVTYPSVTMTISNGTSWVVGFGGAVSATNFDAAPTGSCGTPTLRSGTSITNIAGWDTNGGVSSCAATTKSISPTGAWRADTVELEAAPAATAIISNVVQYISFSHSGQTGNTFVLDLPNATLTNNFYNLTFSYQWVTSQPTITVTDQGTLNTWVNSISLANTTDNINTKVYTVTGGTAGVTQITVVFSASVSDFHWEFQELNGIATSSAIDGTSVSAVATAPYVSAGSITTTQSNDLIYRDCVYTSNGMWTSVSTAIYHPGGNYSFLGADRTGSSASMAYIQNASGADNAYMAFVGSAGFDMNCIGMALKTSGGAGTALPAGIRVVGELNYEASEAATQTIQMTYLFGNTIAFGTLLTQSGSQFTGVSDTNSNAYTIHQTADYPAWALSCNTTGGDSVLLTFTGMSTAPGAMFFWDISGAKATSSTACYDSTAGYQTATGSQSGTSNITNAPSITPSTTNGLVLAIEQVGNGPTQLLASPTGSSAFYDCTYFTGATDAEAFCFGGGYAHYYNATTSAINWAWQMNNSPGGTSYNTSSIALEAAPAGSGHCAACDMSFLEQR